MGVGSNTDKNRWFRIEISNEYELSDLCNAKVWITNLSIDIDYRGYSQEITATTKNGRSRDIKETYNERSYTITLDQDVTEYVSLKFSKTNFTYIDKTLSAKNKNRFNQRLSVTDVITSLASSSISFYPLDLFDFDFEFSSGKTIFDNSCYNTTNTGIKFTITSNDCYSINYSYDKASTEIEKIVSKSIGFSFFWDIREQ